MIYVANGQLYLRSMAELESKLVSVTDRPQFAIDSPSFSPDGRSVAFWAGDPNVAIGAGAQNGGVINEAFGGVIKRIAITGGASVTLCSAGNPYGLSWEKDGTILYGQPNGIMRISSNGGGKPETLIPLKPDEVADTPQLLPGGRAVLFTLATSVIGDDRWNRARIVVQSLKTGERKPLIEGGSSARYVPTGHIVYAFNGTLFAVPFDVKRLAVTGGSSLVLEGVRRFTNPGQTGVAHFSISDTGSLIYIPGPVAGTAGSLQNPLVLIDRSGNAKSIPLPPGPYRTPRVSPDGKRIAFWTNGPKEYSVWIYELSGATSMRRLNIGGASRYPIWSADNQHVAFQNVRDDGIDISWQLADGTGVAEQLVKAEVGLAPVPEVWSPTSQNFLFSIGKENGGAISLRTFSMPDKKSAVFAESESRLVARSVFSPNGRWVAYQSSETGRNEIFVQPFPVTGTKYQVSKDGGRQPLWSPDVKELFYNSTLAGVGRLVSVKIATQPSFTFGNPTPIPVDGILPSGGGGVRDFDITPDGKFIVVKTGLLPSDRTPLQVQVVLNWFRELQERVPVK